jgi:hypothetical protein
MPEEVAASVRHGVEGVQVINKEGSSKREADIPMTHNSSTLDVDGLGHARRARHLRHWRWLLAQAISSLG